MTEVELAIKYLENIVNSQYWSLIENTDDFREIKESILILTKELKSNSIPKNKIRELLKGHNIEFVEDTIAMSEQGAFGFMLSIKELLEEE